MSNNVGQIRGKQMKIDKQAFLEKSIQIINTKKIITQDVKNQLIHLDYKEVVIGFKDEHQISSREVKLDFHGYDIAIGISCRPISYASGRQYRALAIKFIKRKTKKIL